MLADTMDMGSMRSKRRGSCAYDQANGTSLAVSIVHLGWATHRQLAMTCRAADNASTAIMRND
jgi:hypothetical protein